MLRIHTNQRGYSLVEVIVVIVILAIAIPPLINLFSNSTVHSVNAGVTAKAILFTQEKMEEIIADKRAGDAGRGHDWVVTSGRYATDMPDSGYVRTVSIDTAGIIYNSTRYAKVEVTVTHSNIPDVVLTTWLTSY